MTRDQLTGLGDRAEFSADWRTGGEWSSWAALDLDGLKPYNDRHGYAEGDLALLMTARHLVDRVPAGSRVYRTGGDEFGVLSPSGAAELAEALTLANRADSVGRGVLSFSSGVVAVTDDADLDQVLRDADAALWYAKSHGRARVVVHDDETRAFVEDRRTMFEQLRTFQAEMIRWRTEALTDPLTGLGNRRALDRQLELADRTVGELSWAVVFVDVDEFHDFNHRHGDHAGDRALSQVAEALTAGIRAEDVLASGPAAGAFRKGGEEFVVVAQVPDSRSAAALGERLRRLVEDLHVPHGAEGRPYVTVSVGVSVTGHACSVSDALLVAADRAFWLKDHGRRNEVRAEDTLV